MKKRMDQRNGHGNERALPDNPACALSGTKYCRLLNMRACGSCTVRDYPRKQEIVADLDFMESLLPAGGVAQLFQTKECSLCKGEKKGARHGYAILDMAHPEPKRFHSGLFGKRSDAAGTLIPLQFAVCDKCRRRLLWIEYTPVLFPLVIGFTGLFLLADGPVSDLLKSWAPVAPVAAWAAATAVGLLAGRLVSDALMRRAKRVMYADVMQHPLVREMLEKGWTPIGRNTGTKVLFSKARIARGFGTAPNETPSPARETGENREKPENV